MDGGTAVPALDGKRPSQAPAWTITGGITSNPIASLTVSANVRFEGARYADDQNNLRLAPATRVNANIAWSFAEGFSLYAAADNIFDDAIATTMGADGIISYDAPRAFRVGLNFTH